MREEQRKTRKNNRYDPIKDIINESLELSEEYGVSQSEMMIILQTQEMQKLNENINGLMDEVSSLSERVSDLE